MRLKAMIITSWLLCGAAACNDSEPLEGETPAKQFTLHGVHIDEKRADGTVWQGTAEKSEGDLTTNEFTNADLTVTTKEGRKYLVHSPTGVFDFDSDIGTFQDSRVTDEGGGVVYGGQAHYKGADHIIDADGPVKFLTPEMRSAATRATIHLDTGTVDVTGPVIGRYWPGHL
jgi:hypothetical protein